MSSKRFFWGVLLGLFFSYALAGSAVYERNLGNGMKILIKEDHRSPIVLSSVWYKVGGSYEESGITGISHALEHMMFRGTSKYGAGVFSKKVDQVGGLLNAVTSEDFTYYFEYLPVDQLELSFDLESDRMRNALLTEADFRKEIEVVKEEYRMRLADNPQVALYERLNAAAFVNSPNRHIPIGWMTDLQNMTVDDVRRWYDAWYRPNNAILIVVGDVNPEKTYEMAKRYFGSIPAKPVPLLKPRTEEPSLGEIRVDVNLPAQLPYIEMGYFSTSLTDKVDAKDAYALDFLSSLMGSGSSSRFQQNLVRNQQLATDMWVDYDVFSLHPGLWYIGGSPTPTVSTLQLEQAIRQELNQLKATQVSKEEFDRVKAQLKAEKIYGRDSLSNQMSVLAYPEVVGLSWQMGEDYLDAIEQVTPEQLEAVARKYFQDKRLTVATLDPIIEEK